MAELCPDCKNKPAGHCRPKGQPEPELCYWCFTYKRRREKQREAARRRRENPRVLAGVDIDAAVAALRQLPPIQGLIGRGKISVDVVHKSDGAYRGTAWTGRRKIRISAGPTTTAAEILLLVLHELCHLALPRHNHDERFRRVLARCALEAWSIEAPITPGKYSVDAAIEHQLTELVESGSVDCYPPAPVEKPSRNARSAALVAKRAEEALRGKTDDSDVQDVRDNAADVREALIARNVVADPSSVALVAAMAARKESPP